MKRLLLPVLLVLLQVACTTETDRITPVSERAAAPESGPELSLNKGHKWLADEVTTECMRNMEQLMHHFFYLQDLDSPEANRELAQALQLELETIYHNCTMTGPAHEALHTFLVPVEKDIRLLQAANPAVAGRARIRLEDQLLAYEDFFRNP